MSYRPITDMEIEWAVPRQLTEIDIRSYPERILIEHSCENCGCGFSSIKPSPRFCSNECRLEWWKDGLSARSSELWTNQEFVEKIHRWNAKDLKVRQIRTLAAICRCVEDIPRDPDVEAAAKHTYADADA